MNWNGPRIKGNGRDKESLPGSLRPGRIMLECLGPSAYSPPSTIHRLAALSLGIAKLCLIVSPDFRLIS